MSTTAPPPPGPWGPCLASLPIGKFLITEPMLVPTCILALIIGVHYFKRIGSFKALPGHVTYSVSFLLFGIMMTSALFVHCFLAMVIKSPPVPLPAMVFTITDVALTSSVGLSWSFNGLVDVGLVKETWKLYTVMALSFLGLAASWTFEMLRPAGPSVVAFVGLYFGPILISAIIYSLCQLYRFFRGETEGWYWFVGAEISAFLGVVCASDPTIATYFCKYLGPTISPWVNADFWWFILSDVSMFCYAKFFLARTAPVDKRGFAFQLAPLTA